MIKKEVEKLLQFVQKPARYTGGELNSVEKDKDKIDLRYAFCFPDTYEIGMSHLGMKILYGVVNEREDAWCERVFAPDTDMEDLMRQNGVPLFALESGDYIKDFDMIGFTLQYELCYTNVLNMLDLAGLPVKASERDSLTPIIAVGGPCTCNPEPMVDFVDIIFLGEGEESTNEVLDILKACKQKGETKQQFLKKVKDVCGIYVPSFYQDEYNEDGTLKSLTPAVKGAPLPVKKSVIRDMNTVYYPKEFVVPFINIVHDRAVEEIFRGCIRGCRFCQAGFIYRPIREKSVETINRQSKALIDSTGYDELSLCSLSTSDHSDVNRMLSELIDWTVNDKINLSLPSLRVDNFSDELVDKLNKVRKSGLTFAPEAGTQRLRDVINKNVTEEEVLTTCNKAFDNGWTSVKLYFMMGLPTETMEDIEGIADLGMKVVHAFGKNPNTRGSGVQVSISCASFIPKPFTPFQWEPEDTMESLKAKQAHLLESIPSKKIKVSYHETPTSLLEGVLARGDRRLGKVLYSAFQKGCKFDSWDDKFNFEAWMSAFEENGIDPLFYTQRRREFSELLPWDHLDYGVSRTFLERENLRAHENKTTPHCRIQCAGCGANLLNGGHCDARD